MSSISETKKPPQFKGDFSLWTHGESNPALINAIDP